MTTQSRLSLNWKMSIRIWTEEAIPRDGWHHGSLNKTIKENCKPSQQKLYTATQICVKQNWKYWNWKLMKRRKQCHNSGGSRIFPRGGVNPPGGAWTRQIFPKTAWNRKNLDAQGGRASLTPPLDPPMHKFEYIPEELLQTTVTELVPTSGDLNWLSHGQRTDVANPPPLHSVQKQVLISWHSCIVLIQT